MVVVDEGGVVEHAEGNIACTAGDIEDCPGFSGLVGEGRGTGVKGAHEGVFPEAVDTHGHEVVHGVVGGGNGGEDVFDSRFFGGFGDGFEAEVGGAVILGRERLLFYGLDLFLGEAEGAGKASVGLAFLETAS